MKLIVVAVALAAVTLGACGSDGGGHHQSGDNEPMSAGGSVPGAAADDGEASREIVVVASDDLRFDPSTVEVGTGEVVTFVVRNEGQTAHEFVLGDAEYQEVHGDEMGGGHDMPGMGNVLAVGPGETAKITWRFDEPGEILYGCHEPGHYEGGMVGTIEVG